MKCPNCGTEFKRIVNGQIVNVQVERCVCGFVMTKTNKETIVEYAAKNIIEQGNKYLQTGDSDYLEKLLVYTDLLELELSKEYPTRFEGSC